METAVTISIPGSKSHTIRALLIAAMADGESILTEPLESSDTLSCVKAIEAMGAVVQRDKNQWIVRGVGENFRDPNENEPVTIDVGNSGTTLYLATTLASLSARPYTFDGDEQIRRRSAGNLLNALRALGVDIDAVKGEFAPYTVNGPLQAGLTRIKCPTSQYLSALLLAVPLISPASPAGRTIIDVPLLYEKPYVEMTLSYLLEQGIDLDVNGDFSRIVVPCGQCYTPFNKRIPADFSSATFFFCAAALTGRRFFFPGLDNGDTQGDKEVLRILESMGVSVEWGKEGVYVEGPGEGVLLEGGSFDLNAIPDSLPALAVTACFAGREVRLENVPQAREKETDRISVMAQELTKLGGSVAEMEDGLIIYPGKKLRGAAVSGHGDHRVIMALSVASLMISEPVEIDDTSAVAITFPGFFEILNRLKKS